MHRLRQMHVVRKESGIIERSIVLLEKDIPFEVDRQVLADFCRKHHIAKLAFFGSVLRDDFRPDSDVDVLVEFEPEQIHGLFELIRMQLEFSEIIGREADFRTPNDLGRYIRDRVIAGARVQYAA